MSLKHITFKTVFVFIFQQLVFNYLEMCHGILHLYYDALTLVILKNKLDNNQVKKYKHYLQL